MDLTPRDGHATSASRPAAPPRRRRGGRRAVVLALVLVGGRRRARSRFLAAPSLLLLQRRRGRRRRPSCAADRRFRLQGTVDAGLGRAERRRRHDFTIAFNGVTHPGALPGRARRDRSRRASRSWSRARWRRTATFAGDRILVKHTERVRGGEPRPRRRRASRRRDRAASRERRARHAPASRLGLGRLACSAALTLVRRRSCRHRPPPRAHRARVYAWLVLGRRGARRRGHGAGADHPRLLAGLRRSRSARRRRRRCSTSPRCGARSRARSCCGSLILARLHWRPSCWRFRHRLDDPLVGWALVVMFVISAFFFLLLARPGQPVQAGRRRRSRPTGPGPTRCCRTTCSWLFHPPMLYLGYVGFTVPFAFAIAALVTGRVGEGWLLETRRWTLFAWGFLTVGIVLGALVELRGARLGRRVGVGPGRERQLPAVADRHRLHPLGAGAGAARDAAGLEPVAARAPRSALTILGTFLTRSRRARQRARLQRRRHRRRTCSAFFGLIVVVSIGADRLARRSAALARRDRLADVARGRVPRQQRAVRACSPSSCCSARCSR